MTGSDGALHRPGRRVQCRVSRRAYTLPMTIDGVPLARGVVLAGADDRALLVAGLVGCRWDR